MYAHVPRVKEFFCTRCTWYKLYCSGKDIFVFTKIILVALKSLLM
jgi:hypothetical protein